MPRIQGLAESGLLTENVLVKTGKGYVFSITISWVNQTAGSKVVLRDGTDGGGTPAVAFVLPTTHGTITKEWSQGKEFVNGIFFDEGSAEVEAELTFK